MASPCVICMGQSGKPLAGKRCTASACKTEDSKRMKAAKIGVVELQPGRDGRVLHVPSYPRTISILGSRLDPRILGFRPVSPESVRYRHCPPIRPSIALWA